MYDAWHGSLFRHPFKKILTSHLNSYFSLSVLYHNSLLCLSTRCLFNFSFNVFLYFLGWFSLPTLVYPHLLCLNVDVLNCSSNLLVFDYNSTASPYRIFQQASQKTVKLWPQYTEIIMKVTTLKVLSLGFHTSRLITRMICLNSHVVQLS